MQQTQKYKLNLIESSDTFSPQALNENTRKTEDAMLAHESAVEATTDALDARLTVLEGHHFACGTYSGTIHGAANDVITQMIHLPFTPRAVYIHKTDKDADGLCVEGLTSSKNICIVEGGFQASYDLNTHNLCFIAFA